MGGNGYGEPLFRSVCRAWKADPHGFWADAASAIDWFERRCAHFPSLPAALCTGFRDGVTNTCHNCLDRPCRGPAGGEQAGFIYDSPSPAGSRGSPMRDLLADVKGDGCNLPARLGVTRAIAHHLHADDSAGRRSPCRGSADRRGAFCRFRRPLPQQNLPCRIDDCQAKLVSGKLRA